MNSLWDTRPALFWELLREHGRGSCNFEDQFYVNPSEAESSFRFSRVSQWEKQFWEV